MEDLNYMEHLNNLNSIIEIIEIFFIILCTYYTFIKITNIRESKIKNMGIIIFTSLPLAIVTKMIQLEIFVYLSWIVIVFFMSLENYFIFKREFTYSLLVTTISLCISYVVYIISVMISYFPNILLNIQYEAITLCIIIFIYIALINRMFKIKKLKYGISFLEKKVHDQKFNVIILNIGVMSLHSCIILHSYSGLGATNIGISFSIIVFILFLTIKQSFDLYYKQNLLTKDLEHTKAELEEKKKEIEKLEKENLEFSKTSHSLAHKQKALEFKLDELMKNGNSIEGKEFIKQEIENISKEVYKEPENTELKKTDIAAIDNMFAYMKSECIKDNIKFELQVTGNIHYMINHLISENDLELLIADHIKDAIIAINYSDNENRSILARIGKIDNVYGLYIYDSGIEFEKEVLENLGKKPITTHADSGGTGMGFMNTFDTLNKTKASLIINEIGKPCIDNYTKVLIFRFDNKNEFKVNSYKSEAMLV